MKKLALLVALALCACNREPQEDAVGSKASIPEEIVATPAAQSKAPAVIPMPKEQAEVDRLILAGYSPHGTHLHPPGMKKCPFEGKGKEAVM